MNPILTVIIVMTVILGVAALWVAIVDARADRAHQRWMRRNDTRRRRTQVVVQGIRYRPVGLDGEADHTGALRKHTAP